MPSQFTILHAGEAHEVSAAIAGPGEDPSVRVSPQTVSELLGWELKPQGLCRGETCVPVRDPDSLRDAEGIDLSQLARALGQPLALDVEERVAVIGAAADERRRQLESLDAPDFTLPDLAGKPQRLSEHRGKKVLLIAYASW